MDHLAHDLSSMRILSLYFEHQYGINRACRRLRVSKLGILHQLTEVTSDKFGIQNRRPSLSISQPVVEEFQVYKGSSSGDIAIATALDPLPIVFRGTAFSTWWIFSFELWCPHPRFDEIIYIHLHLLEDCSYGPTRALLWHSDICRLAVHFLRRLQPTKGLIEFESVICEAL